MNRGQDRRQRVLDEDEQEDREGENQCEVPAQQEWREVAGSVGMMGTDKPKIDGQNKQRKQLKRRQGTNGDASALQKSGERQRKGSTKQAVTTASGAEDDKQSRKGAKKALRHEVKKAVKAKSKQIAQSLVDRAGTGDVRSATLVISLMEHKKKDAGQQTAGDGLNLAQMLASEPQWKETSDPDK